MTPKKYGVGNTSFLAAGGEAGIRKSVDAFYDHMGCDERFARIYEMHPKNIEISRDKLARFLCGWLGGPKRYHEKYGPINIPAVHGHLEIGENERDQWIQCMTESIAEQPYPDDFKKYLVEQLSVPAEAIRRYQKQE
jgi:hemoglobin